MLGRVSPIMPSRDVPATSAFYGRLGFLPGYDDGRYLIVVSEGAELHFFAAPEHVPERSDHGLYARPADVDAFSARVEALGLPRETGFPRFHPAEDKPWGMREATLWDPDGHLLRVGQEID